MVQLILNPSYDTILRLIETSAREGKLAIIDYGCGNGYLLDLFSKSRVQSYVGYDVSDDALHVGKQKHGEKHIHFKKMVPTVVPDLGKENSADVVILIGVLQYMNDAEIAQLLKKSLKVLRPGGVFIASTVVDREPYKWFNMYRFIFPNRYIQRAKIVEQLRTQGYSIEVCFEKGLIINPLVFHGLVIPFDVCDRFLLNVRGRLGFFGRAIRLCFLPLLRFEFLLPVDRGYTLFLVGKKV